MIKKLVIGQAFLYTIKRCLTTYNTPMVIIRDVLFA